MPDALFAIPRLAAVYDPLDPDRSDLDVFAAVVEDLERHDVIDLGCGTGTFACVLARREKNVIGVDPAEASLDVARRKTGADRGRWVSGDWTTLGGMETELITMTGNVAQVSVADEDWDGDASSLPSCASPGRMARARNPRAGQAGMERLDARRVVQSGRHPWRRHCQDVDGTDRGSLASRFVQGDVRLRIRWCRLDLGLDPALPGPPEVEASLEAADFNVADVRDAPDRPGRELVFVARVVGTSAP